MHQNFYQKDRNIYQKGGFLLVLTIIFCSKKICKRIFSNIYLSTFREKFSGTERDNMLLAVVVITVASYLLDQAKTDKVSRQYLGRLPALRPPPLPPSFIYLFSSLYMYRRAPPTSTTCRTDIFPARFIYLFI